MKTESARLRPGISGSPAGQLVLALGHSARDTFTMLHEAGIAMEAKDFAVGVRVEHPQKLIDQNQYKEASGHPAFKKRGIPADLSRRGEGRGVYSFCMCPGGMSSPAPARTKRS